MTASVFLSCPTPYLKVQQTFIEKLNDDLKGRCLLPRTVGVTDFDMKALLSSIRSLMLDCNGLIAIAFRRHQIKEGAEKPDSDTGVNHNDLSGEWFRGRIHNGVDRRCDRWYTKQCRLVRPDMRVKRTV